MAEVAYDAVVETFEQLPKPRRRDPDAVAEAVRARRARRGRRSNGARSRMCIVHVLVV